MSCPNSRYKIEIKPEIKQEIVEGGCIQHKTIFFIDFFKMLFKKVK